VFNATLTKKIFYILAANVVSGENRRLPIRTMANVIT